MLTRFWHNAGQLFGWLNLVALCGFASTLICSWDRVAGYIFGAQAGMILLSLFMAWLTEVEARRDKRRHEQQRELVKLSKKKGIEF